MPDLVGLADLGKCPKEHELGARYWGGIGHVPLRMRTTRTPFTKPNDPIYKQPVLVGDAKVKQLDMSVETDRKALADLMSWQAAGAVSISCFERAFDQNTGNWKVFVVYLKLVYEDPQELVDRIKIGWEREEF